MEQGKVTAACSSRIRHAELLVGSPGLIVVETLLIITNYKQTHINPLQLQSTERRTHGGGRASVFCCCCTDVIQKKVIQLSAMDILALATMKNAAKCDT